MQSIGRQVYLESIAGERFGFRKELVELGRLETLVYLIDVVSGQR